MKFKTFLSITALLFLLSACNYPSLPRLSAPTTPPPPPTVVTMTPTQATRSPKPTKTATPAQTQNPADLSPIPPTAANATPILVTLPALPTAAPFTATPFVPTPGDPTPISRALFQGTFTGGTLSFRINEPSNAVIPKAVILKGAKCKEGQGMSTSITFEPPSSFEIFGGGFTITKSANQVTITGQFLSPTRAGGTIIMRLRVKDQPCTIGPLPWIATAS